jgi:hypothetical protein
MRFQWPRLRFSGSAAANVCTEEAVSDVQLAGTCIAAIVGCGTAHIILADGSRIFIPKELVNRSGVLAELANSTELSSSVLVGGRTHLHNWSQYLQSSDSERNSYSWLALLRSLLVRFCAWLLLVHIFRSFFKPLCFFGKQKAVGSTFISKS